MFEATVRAGVCRLARPGTRWLSTGYGGGEAVASAGFNVSVPAEWPETDLDAYAAARRDRAGFEAAGPTLFTGVDLAHARRARLDSVEAVVTAGLSNPAALPLDDPGRRRPDDRAPTDREAPAHDGDDVDRPPVGTVNVFVGTTRALGPGALENLLAVAAEAKAATLLQRAGFTGTTSDAVVAACDPAGERTAFSGSATPVGNAVRACVRDALLASLDAHYDGDDDPPAAVADAPYGVVTADGADVSSL